MQKKRFYTLVLAACFVLGMIIFPVSAATDSGTFGEGFTWTFDTDTKTLTFSGVGTLTGLPVESSEAYMKYRLDVRHIVIAEGITAVADDSFPRGVFFDVESIHIADSVESIGNYAFANYMKMKQLHLGKGLKTIEEAAFMTCQSLEELVLPAGLQSIGSQAFTHCAIKELVIPEGINVIEEGTFRASETLTRVYLPTSVTEIKYAAFRDSDKITDVYYAGTKAQWESIDIDDTVDGKGGSNTALLYATIHYEHPYKAKEETSAPQPTTPTQPTTPETRPTTPETQPTTQPATQPNEEQNTTTAPTESLKPTQTDPAQTQPTEDTGGEEAPAKTPWVAIAIGAVVLIAVGGVVVWLCIKKRK